MDKMELSRKLEQLAALAASRENRLEMTEVLDAFKELQVTPEEMEDGTERRPDPGAGGGGGSPA